MKRLLLIYVMVGTFVLGLKANPVDLETAQALAAKFMGTRELHLVSIYHTENKVTAFYVFNTSDGFVIVSADDCETPIIGYSHESRFDPNNKPQDGSTITSRSKPWDPC